MYNRLGSSTREGYAKACAEVRRLEVGILPALTGGSSSLRYARAPDRLIHFQAQGGGAVPRLAHNQEIAGSIPAPATFETIAVAAEPILPGQRVFVKNGKAWRGRRDTDLRSNDRAKTGRPISVRVSAGVAREPFER